MPGGRNGTTIEVFLFRPASPSISRSVLCRWIGSFGSLPRCANERKPSSRGLPNSCLGTAVKDHRRRELSNEYFFLAFTAVIFYNSAPYIAARYGHGNTLRDLRFPLAPSSQNARVTDSLRGTNAACEDRSQSVFHC